MVYFPSQELLTLFNLSLYALSQFFLFLARDGIHRHLNNGPRGRLRLSGQDIATIFDKAIPETGFIGDFLLAKLQPLWVLLVSYSIHLPLQLFKLFLALSLVAQCRAFMTATGALYLFFVLCNFFGQLCHPADGFPLLA